MLKQLGANPKPSKTMSTIVANIAVFPPILSGNLDWDCEHLIMVFGKKLQS